MQPVERKRSHARHCVKVFGYASHTCAREATDPRAKPHSLQHPLNLSLFRCHAIVVQADLDHGGGYGYDYDCDFDYGNNYDHVTITIAILVMVMVMVTVTIMFTTTITIINMNMIMTKGERQCTYRTKCLPGAREHNMVMPARVEEVESGAAATYTCGGGCRPSGARSSCRGSSRCCCVFASISPSSSCGAR